MSVASLKQKINIKYFMVAYIGGILVYSSLVLGTPERLGKGLLVVVIYAAFDLLWTYARDKVWYLPLSSWISGFIISVVAIPNPPLALVILLPLLAVASKQLLHFGKPRHIFNPASFAMAVGALFMIPTVSWWGVAWGTTPLLIAAIAGIFILWRQDRWHVAAPFFLSYAAFLLLLFILNGIPAAQLLIFLKPQILDGTTLFFSTVMLIEPLTSTFPTRRHRLIYGVLVGFFAVLITYLMNLFAIWAPSFANNIDPLVFGLLLGNLLASLAFLPSRPRPMAPSTPIQAMTPPPISNIF